VSDLEREVERYERLYANGTPFGFRMPEQSAKQEAQPEESVMVKVGRRYRERPLFGSCDRLQRSAAHGPAVGRRAARLYREPRVSGG
jgi:hypothetical protein